MLSKLLLLVLSLLFHLIAGEDECKASLVETVPAAMNFESNLTLLQTDELFYEIVSKATFSIQICAFYITLSCNDFEKKVAPESCRKGERVVDALVEALKRGVRVEIAINEGTKMSRQSDLETLRENGAQIVNVNFQELTGGVLHSKFIIIDYVSFYLGSANIDWRSLSEVKELGIYLKNCYPLASDLQKIFRVYVKLGQKAISAVPEYWPQTFGTSFSNKKPMKLNLDGEVSAFISHSPESMNPSGRASDIDAIVYAIDSAESFIGIEVMDYSPYFHYGKERYQYWPTIDVALRGAVFGSNVTVKIVGGIWENTRKNMIISLRSLDRMKSLDQGGSIHAKLLRVPVPEEKTKLRYIGVNHCKFIVTDKLIYIGTSNWSGDYFTATAGVGITIIPEDKNHFLLRQLRAVHERDFESDLASHV